MMAARGLLFLLLVAAGAVAQPTSQANNRSNTSLNSGFIKVDGLNFVNSECNSNYVVSGWNG